MLLERIPVRIRLTLGHAFWVGVIFVAIGFGVFRVVEDSLLQSLDTTLLTSAKTLRNSHLARSREFPGLHGLPALKSLLDEFYGEQRLAIRAYAQMVDMSGRVQAKTDNIRAHLPVTPLAVTRAEKGLETFETFDLKEGPPLRQVTLPVFRGNRFSGELIQVGAPMDASLEALASVGKMIWVTLLLGLCISIIFGYILVKQAFRPVARITAAVAKLGINDLSMRLKLPPAHDELRVLTYTFNEMLDRLEDAFSRLRRFAGDVSHELRTPLAVLKGEVELALRRERTPEEYKEALRTILTESKNMSTIVEDLLLLARAQGNSIALKIEEVDVDRFLEDIKASVLPTFQAREVQLEVLTYGQNPLRLSPTYFAMILKNLLLNACRHSERGGRVELKYHTFETYHEFSIRDEGEGIPEDALPYIFDAFYRADTARNRSSGGVGIGLSLAQALARLHGGAITVKSKLNEGSTFTVRLPRQKPSSRHIAETTPKDVVTRAALASTSS